MNLPGKILILTWACGLTVLASSSHTGSLLAAENCSGLDQAIEVTGNTARVQECTATIPPSLDSLSDLAERDSKLREYRKECITSVSPIYARAIYEVNCSLDCSVEDEKSACAKLNANAIKGQLRAFGLQSDELDALKQEATGSLGVPATATQWWDYYTALKKRLATEVANRQNSPSEVRTAVAPSPTSGTPSTSSMRPSRATCATLLPYWESATEGQTCKSPKKLSHLTFDDGPDTITTKLALDTLEAKGVKATFFVLGERLQTSNPARPSKTVEQRLQLVKRMMRDGHVVGSHSLSHDAHTGLLPEEVASYAKAARKAGVGVMVDGKPMPEYLSAVYRLPYGDGFSGKGVRSSIAEPFAAQGFKKHLYWNIDSEDWEAKNKTNPDITMEKILHDMCTTGGGVILMHDIHPSTVTNLGRWIDAARCAGYDFGSYSQVVGPVPRFDGGGTASTTTSSRVSDSEQPRAAPTNRERTTEELIRDLSGASDAK